MQTESPNLSVSKRARIAGYIIGTLPALLMIFAGTMKLIQPAGMAEDFQKSGFSPSLLTPLGTVEMLCAIIFLIPQTTVLGAILMTGFLGGAVCATLPMGGPMFLIPGVIGTMPWLGLYLRDPRIRDLIPLRK